MKMWFTERGASLITLIIIIVVVGILGAGLVSLMGSKQRSYPLQAQSYQAFNIANAGIEFAIRYAADNPPATGSGLVVNSTLLNGVTLNFGDGTFTIKYYDDINGDGTKDYTIQSIGEVGRAKREIRVSQFLGYVTGGGGVVLTPVVDPDPEYDPDAQAGEVTTHVTNLDPRTAYVKYIKITMIPAVGSVNLIDDVFLAGQLVYQAKTDPLNPNYIYQNKNSIYVCVPPPTSTGTCPAGSVTPLTIPYTQSLPSTFILPNSSINQQLTFSAASVKGEYTVTFFYDFDPNTTYDPRLENSTLAQATVVYTIQ